MSGRIHDILSPEWLFLVTVAMKQLVVWIPTVANALLLLLLVVVPFCYSLILVGGRPRYTAFEIYFLFIFKVCSGWDDIKH